jgi:hypothetical protein
MDRVDDCMRAAIATVLQVPDVPDPRLHERLRAGDDPKAIDAASWAIFAEWLDGRGLGFAFHAKPPVDRERWIAIVEPPTGAALAAANDLVATADGLRRAPAGIRTLANPFDDHCVVMRLGEILHDPAVGLEAPPGMRLHRAQVADIRYGITIDRKEAGNA